MARVVVPIGFRSDSTVGGNVTSNDISSIRSTIGRAKNAVEQYQESLNSKRQDRLSHILSKEAFKDGFVQAQAALIGSSESVDTRSLIGSINTPMPPSNYEARTKQSLESGSVSSLFNPVGYYELSAVSSSEVIAPGPSTVVSVLDSYATECPINADPSSTAAQKQDELNTKPMCVFRKNVVVEINGLSVTYGNLETVTVSLGDQLTDKQQIGTATQLYFSGKKIGEPTPLENFLLYTESITPSSISVPTASANYQTSSSNPYGPHWKSTRPGGLPEAVRLCSGRGEAGAIILNRASTVTTNTLFGSLLKAFNTVLTGGYIGMPSTGFDARCSVEEMALNGTECFIDSGPVPRGSSFTLVAAPTRSTREDFISNWGAFQFSLSEWRALHSSATFMGYTHSHSVTGTTPWEATEEDEILSPATLLYGIWEELGEANNLHKTLFMLLGLVSLEALKSAGDAVQASNGDINEKCKSAWESLSPTYTQQKSLVENLVIHSRTSVSKLAPEVMAGIADDAKPELEYKGAQGWQETPPHRWVKRDTFGIGSGNSTKSYPFVRIGTEHADFFDRAYNRIIELGGKFTSSGGRRALSKGRLRSVSMHQIGRAFDLSINTGLIVDPRIDAPESCYLVIADDRTNIRSTFTVWAKVFPESGNADAIQQAREDGTIVNTVFDVDLYSTRWPSVTDKKIVQWEGEAFNLTKILEDNGYSRIRPISDYYERNSYMGLEWWHYEIREGLIQDVTRVEEELQKYYTYEQAAVSASTRHPNFEGVKNKVWAGSYFR